MDDILLNFYILYDIYIFWFGHASKYFIDIFLLVIFNEYYFPKLFFDETTWSDYRYSS